MAQANTSPIFSKVADVQWTTALVQAVATTPYDSAGTIGTDIFKVFTADATNGGFVQRVRIKYVANGTTASNATILKFFISTISTGTTTASNTVFFDEISIPSTGTQSTTALQPSWDLTLNFPLPAGYSLLVKTTVAQPSSCGFHCTAVGGKY